MSSNILNNVRSKDILEWLTISYCPFLNNELISINSIYPRLRNIDLSGTQLDRVSLSQFIYVFPNIERIRLVDTGVNIEILNYLHNKRGIVILESDYKSLNLLKGLDHFWE